MYEESDYSRTLIIGPMNVDINIFRQSANSSWTLEITLDGNPKRWPHEFIADKAAYDAALAHLKERGIDSDMFTGEEDYEITDSPLNRSLLVEGHRFEIQIYRGADDEGWTLEIVNEKGTSIIPDTLFATDDDALGAAIADFENEPIEEFLG
ncbi:hypothetical protein ROA7450_03363 [Roseovarius albus]|uniref:Uncharacterized protein n=1 Tax=Roseovarius albus TaxID=1247867 RepID=A0A1X6ZXI8_9RHOB|nr:hypothetical protein [Roseovarius albus]SLN63949.1 hypothetical protein ROA7450_03363 [Roseovarius albus]